MFCPTCGQERISTETSFCSRCGFLLTGLAEIIESGGLVPSAQKDSKLSRIWRNRGFKKGLFVFLLTFLVVPIVTLIAIGLRTGPFLPSFAAILFAVGGLLKMIYALMFESPEPRAAVAPAALSSMPSRVNALPPQRSTPVSSYAPPSAGSWRDTKELEPTSVTEGTTKLFDS